MLKLFLVMIVFLSGCTKTIDETKIPLTEDELSYISSKPEIIWAIEENRPPFIYTDKNKVMGLSNEYIELITKKTGLKFKAVNAGPIHLAIQSLKEGKVDILSSVRPTPNRAEFIGFTPPVSYTGGVFLFRLNSIPHQPMTVGVRRGSPADEYMKQRFPMMNVVYGDTDEELINILSQGIIDGVVMDRGASDYWLDKKNIKMREAYINFDYPYSFGYRKDDHILGAILTKAINSISVEEKETLNKGWIK